MYYVHTYATVFYNIRDATHTNFILLFINPLNYNCTAVL